MPSVQASGSSGGGRRGRRAASTLSEINVVPLVDVMLVLLIIFMVTAPMIQRGVEVNLPVSRRAGAIEGKRLFVNVPRDFAKKGLVSINDESVALDQLAERIRQRLSESDDKQVYVRGDGAVTLSDLTGVLDRLKDGGVEQAAIVTAAPRGR